MPRRRSGAAGRRLKLARARELSRISGRATVIPALDHPAVMGGARVSPMNRAHRGLPPSREMHMPEPGCYLITDDAGLYETPVDLDAEVRRSAPVCRNHGDRRGEASRYRSPCSSLYTALQSSSPAPFLHSIRKSAAASAPSGVLVPVSVAALCASPRSLAMSAALKPGA